MPRRAKTKKTQSSYNQAMNQTNISSTQQESQHCSPLADALRMGVLLTGATLTAAAIANAVIAWNTPTAGGRLGGAFQRTPLRYGDAAYFVSGRGTPVLLLHAPRAGNSSAEWEENFSALAQNHTVYALDFLGWGLSDKPNHVLRPGDYAEQIRHFAQDVMGIHGTEKCAVIASGAACQFALLAVERAPELFSKIALICPPSVEEIPQSDPDESGDELPEKNSAAYRALMLPILGQAATNWLSSRTRLEALARQELFFDKTRVTPGLISRMHINAHQSGAQNALAAETAGLLQTDWHAAWSNLEIPALLIWGRGAPGIATVPEWLALQPNAQLEVFEDALLLPHVEHADEFNAKLTKWLASDKSEASADYTSSHNDAQ
jgi:pimeloyl-ACP methyl ester carboxylesterase